MTQELIYTSAPKGLRAGVKGFCTVASTSGMAVTLADRLEMLSGYRHLFPPHEERASQNPVNYSHLTLAVGGQSFHVLSRVCDAGLDYSQRSNKLAHHVALTAQECPPCGPARLLAEPGFMETTWQGEPRILGVGRMVPSLTESPRICTSWQKATGDAGWGGMLAATALATDAKPVHLIVPAGLDTLSLVREALALIPPERRWSVTFSTFFTKLPPGVDCQWRFLIDGQPEAQTARRSPQWQVFDLCTRMPPAPDGPLVTAALTGKLPRNEPAAPKRSRVLVPVLPDDSDASPHDPSSADDEPMAVSPPSAHAASDAPRAPKDLFARPAASRRGVKVAIFAAIALAVATIAAVVGYLALGTTQPEDKEYVVRTKARVTPANVEKKSTKPPSR